MNLMDEHGSPTILRVLGCPASDHRVSTQEYQNQRFPAVWLWALGLRVAKWLKWNQDSIRDSPQKSEFGSRIGLQRPLLLSRENVFDVLGLETGEGGRKWIKRVERNE